MLAWLYNMIVGQFCCHKWETIDEAAIYDSSASTRPFAIKYYLRCEKCGDIKVRKL